MSTNINLNDVGSTKKQNTFLRKHGDILQEDCLGKYCWQTPNWTSDFLCAHDFDSREICNYTVSKWATGYANWQPQFEIQQVTGMGYGLYSKQNWNKGDVLGIYVSELVPTPTANTDYCHQVKVGPQFSKMDAEVAYVDAEKFKNYKRFYNYSCNNNAVVTEARVGVKRVLALRVTRGIRSGEQVTINYISDYFRGRRCRCRSRKCRFEEVVNIVDLGKRSNRTYNMLFESEGLCNCS
jgi:hypothetical protein